MKMLHTKWWWVWALLVFTLQIYAQSDSVDKSPHKSEFITVNNVKQKQKGLSHAAPIQVVQAQQKYFEQEIEHFRREIPNGRTIVFTNADHVCFIDRQPEVLHEMRAFLVPPGPQPPQKSLPLSVEVEIPMPPTPVKADGKWYLVYEVHMTNFHTNNTELVRVEVLRDRATRPMATYADEELSRRLKPTTLVTLVGEELRLESPSDEHEPQVIGRASRAVMYMLITVQRKADIPAALHHRLFFKSQSAAENSKEVVVDAAPVTVNRKAPLVLGPPLRGEGWVAGHALCNDTHHRRKVIVIDGKAQIPERFAIDWTRIDSDGRLVHGDDANNANWHPYGAEVLAVANAVVAGVKDGLPEKEAGTEKWTVPSMVDPGTGNYVLLDLGKSNFALYAHLQPKSIRVRVGQKVRRGEVLGLLGNSGNSYNPHLHFHVVDGNSLLGADGVPYVFESFEVQGVVPPGQLGNWKPPSTAKADKRRREIPIENAVVRFP